MRRVVINVSGKKYECDSAIFSAHKDHLIEMLLRRTDENEIFIQRDQKMFRWVYLWYNTGILVDEGTVGVPLVVWQEELRFYGINPAPEIMTEKRTIDIDMQHDLAVETIAYYKKRRVAEEKKVVGKKKAFETLAKYMLEHAAQTEFEFVAGRHSDLSTVDFEVIHTHWQEFSDYCSSAGFDVRHNYVAANKCEQYASPPASSLAAYLLGAAHGYLYVEMKPRCNTF
jgi:hypothetical protein